MELAREYASRQPWLTITAIAAPGAIKGAVLKTRKYRRRSRRGRRKVEPTIVIAWHPDVFSPEEYAELVGALGDIARAHGAEGVRRIVSESINVDAAIGAFV